MKKLLLIGPRTNRLHPEKTGGVIVLFEQLINELQQSKIQPIIIDANSANYKNKLLGLIFIYLSILKNIFKVKHISLHGTAATYLSVAPFAIMLAKLTGKTTSLRKFAGNFNLYYENSGRINKKVIELVLKYADYSFFETKYLVDYFKRWNENTFWFPNVRERIIFPDMPRHFNKRFVFISHVSKGKGIDQILEASLKLDKSYTIDIYGPILNNEYDTTTFTNYNVSYKGPLKHNEVLNTLNQYDVLLLPSYRVEEGYPGIIIEAYSLGMPIISTSLKSIMEICENGKEGILVEPKNVNQMVNAILFFNSQNYTNFSENAYDKFEIFRSDVHTDSFLKTLKLADGDLI